MNFFKLSLFGTLCTLTVHVNLVGQYEPSRISILAASPVEAQRGAVASDAMICSEIGAQILKLGGNAVDSAVATGICQGFAYPFASGLGGGGLLMITFPNDPNPKFVNFREMSPGKSHRDMFLENPSESLRGAKSVAIPGEIAGFEFIHKQYGKLSWSQLFEPTIKLARKGIPVSPLLRIRLKSFSDIILNSPELSTLFTKNGTLLNTSEIYKNPGLANTLERVSKYGANEFYQGLTAKKIVNFLSSKGSKMSLDDLKKYNVTISEPMVSTYRGYRIVTAPPPGGGALVLLGLNILENFHLGDGFDSTQGHRLMETLKFVYAKRSQLGDPKFVSMEKILTKLTSKYYSKSLSEQIDDSQTFPPEYYKPEGLAADDHGTSHLSVVDEDGMGVSLTCTINTEFGSKLLDLETGILFNNQMDDFSSPNQTNYFNLPPAPNNFIEPYKTPMSSMASMILFDPTGSLIGVIGASGGSRIISTLLQVLTNIIDWNMTLSDAISSPRFHHQLFPNHVKIEEGFSDLWLIQIQSKGHELESIPLIANSNGIMKSNNKWIAVSDTRKMGIAQGY